MPCGVTRPCKTLVCAIVKGEDAYLDEWIAWNLAVGFDDIKLYDNNGDGVDRQARFGRTNETLNGASHKIWVQKWPGQKQQLIAYADCLCTHGPSYDWIALFDVDEFLVLRGAHASIEDVLSEMPEDTAALTVSWRLFGADGKTKYEPGCVIDRFFACNPSIDHHPKSIVRPSRVFADMKDPHVAVVREAGFSNRFANHALFSWTAEQSVREDAARIAVLHHYFTKSKAEWDLKRARGRADNGEVCDDAEFSASNSLSTARNVDAPAFARKLPLLASRCGIS
jgi:hypothetical protein